MSAYPHASRRDLAQQRVEIGAVASFVDRVDPDEYAIERDKLCVHGLQDIVLIDDRFRIDADIGERREYVLEPADLRRGTATRGFIAAPEDRNAAEPSFGDADINQPRRIGGAGVL